jgi:hypothetical protein
VRTTPSGDEEEIVRTLVVVENVSLDGVMQAPGRPDEDERGGFPYGGWASRMLADDPEVVQASLGESGTGAEMLFGRRTSSTSSVTGSRLPTRTRSRRSCGAPRSTWPRAR